VEGRNFGEILHVESEWKKGRIWKKKLGRKCEVNWSTGGPKLRVKNMH
jgi:hypothetical protein